MVRRELLIATVEKERPASFAAKEQRSLNLRASDSVFASFYQRINSFGFTAKKWIAVDFQLAGASFPTGAMKRIAGPPDLNVDETGFLHHPLPACARQAAGNSCRP